MGCQCRPCQPPVPPQAPAMSVSAVPAGTAVLNMVVLALQVMAHHKTMWHGGQSGFVNMVLRNESGSPGLSAVKPDPKAPMSPAGPTPSMPMDAGMLSMMMALQNQPPSTGSTGPNNFPSMPPPRFVRAPEPEFTPAATRELSPSQALPPGPQPPRSQNENKKGKPRKDSNSFASETFVLFLVLSGKL